MTTHETGNEATESRNARERESELTPKQLEEAVGAGGGITKDTLTVTGSTPAIRSEVWT
jgi:hypothetical protein